MITIAFKWPQQDPGANGRALIHRANGQVFIHCVAFSYGDGGTLRLEGVPLKEARRAKRDGCYTEGSTVYIGRYAYADFTRPSYYLGGAYWGGFDVESHG